MAINLAPQVNKLLTSLVLTFAALPLCASDEELVDHTKAQACEILKRHMAKIEGLPGAKPLPEWYCDFWDADSDKYFYIVALWTAPIKRLGIDHAQSAGHFAVAKRSNLVLYYDLVNERLLPIPKAYYATPSPNRTTSDSQRGGQ